MSSSSVLFFFTDTAPTEIYTLSLHDALPILRAPLVEAEQDSSIRIEDLTKVGMAGLCLGLAEERSEEHTSELQSLTNLVCRLLLEKKKKTRDILNEHDSYYSSTQRTPSPRHN